MHVVGEPTLAPFADTARDVFRSGVCIRPQHNGGESAFLHGRKRRRDLLFALAVFGRHGMLADDDERLRQIEWHADAKVEDVIVETVAVFRENLSDEVDPRAADPKYRFGRLAE